ncbi:NIPSNAP family protein [Gaoshiqia sediminis]|uniref:NIPSNAP family protein n=1 Tax=Gaoshiqia sediminis TaxID=2986998 RepID=A0AA41YB50_9BACT|nr:NIPSNAP family protein [Gaoshiqia sediminis]MCW0484438.1 NIPSNAP family protein [Gaoshiqia sediminis]
MKRRNFIKGTALLTGAAVAGQAAASVQPAIIAKEIYEWRVYHFKNNGQKNKVDQFYREALIPALNQMGVKVGAFGEYSQAEPPTVYFLLVYPSLTDYHRVKKAIWQDKSFLQKASSYFGESAENGAYTRFETYLLEAFDAIPKFRQPGQSRGVFELRTYESSNEEAAQRKVAMFNREELTLFDNVGLHPVFFGEILAGPQMPALMYMLWFNDLAERDQNWKRFTSSPEWEEMKVRPEYANTVSVVNKIFLVPLDYSQL